VTVGGDKGFDNSDISLHGAAKLLGKSASAAQVP
jgi:hypothetical protein